MKKFSNPWQHEPYIFLRALQWKLGFIPDDISVYPDATQAAEWKMMTTDELAYMPESGWTVTWLGHASFLLAGCGVRLLIDPIFSEHCSPIALASFRRNTPVPFLLEDLPKIDAVLLTHGHYDHTDIPTLLALGKNTKLVVAERHAAWLRKKGFSDVHEVKWWQDFSLTEKISITATPAKHFNSRSFFDRNREHWCGWSLLGDGVRLWHAGDTGYCEVFREIGERFSAIDFAMIPIGAYAPRRVMSDVHCTPEEAVQIFNDTNTRRAIGMHWGTFELAADPLSEPALLLADAVTQNGLTQNDFFTTRIGEAIHVRTLKTASQMLS